MIELIKLKIELVRKRFGIYGFFNISTLLIVILSIVCGVKYILYKCDYYEDIVRIIVIFYFILFSGNVFRKNEDSIMGEYIFFSKISFDVCEQYEKYKKLIIYYTVLIYLLVPLKLVDMGIFLFYLLFAQILLQVLELGHKYMIKEKYITFKLFLYFGLGITLIAHFRNMIELPKIEITTIWQMIILLILNVFLLKKNLQNVISKEQEETTVYFFGLTKRIPGVRKNKNLLFLIRKNVLFDIIILLIISSIESPKYLSQKDEMLLSYGLTFLVSFVWVYCEILNMETGKLFYYIVSQRVLKLEAIRDIGIVSLLFLGIMCVGNVNGGPFLWVLEAYIQTFTIFVSVAFGISLEKEKEKLMTWRKIGLLYIISVTALIVIQFGLASNF